MTLQASLARLLGTWLFRSLELYARILLALLAHVSLFALTIIFERKSVSQLTQNTLKRIDMQKFYAFDLDTRFAHSAKRERRSYLPHVIPWVLGSQVKCHLTGCVGIVFFFFFFFLCVGSCYFLL